VNSITIFIIRLIMGGLFAFILLRIFRPEAHPAYVIVLTAFLIGTAYGLEYLRKSKRK